MEHCPDLKMVCVAVTGVDHVDLEYCRERVIMVCNCAGYSTVAVVYLVFGMGIDLARNILPCNEAVRRGGTVGVVGGVVGPLVRAAEALPGLDPCAESLHLRLGGYARLLQVDDLEHVLFLCGIVSQGRKYLLHAFEALYGGGDVLVDAVVTE